jgi:hypothetical protein
MVRIDPVLTAANAAMRLGQLPLGQLPAVGQLQEWGTCPTLKRFKQMI